MVSYLQVENLTKSFGDNLLFEKISFGISDNQRVALIAKNGTGKTTLLNIIAGTEDYQDGTISFRRDLRVGYLDQNPDFPKELSVIDACLRSDNEVMRTVAAYEHCMASGDHEKLAELIALMDLHKAWDYETRIKQILGKLKITNFEQKISELSGGQLKRVALANVLISEPELLILDEPTAGLDPRGREEILAQIKSLHRQKQITVILVSHSMEDIGKMVEKILVMNDGEVVFFDTPNRVFTEIATRESIGLAVPEVTYLMRRLKEKYPEIREDIFTVEAAKKEILKVIRG